MNAQISPDHGKLKQAVAFGLVLVLLSNSFAWLLYLVGADRQWAYLPWGILLVTGALLWSRGPARLSWTDLGLVAFRWRRSTLVGALIGLGLSVPLALYFLFPVGVSGPIQYQTIQELSGPGLLWRLGVELTIAVAFTEEVLFRGVLQALFRRSLAVTGALVATNLVFAFWHLVVNALSLQQNAIALPGVPAPAALAIGYIVSLVAVGAGGGLLSLLRERTGNLAGSMVVHWMADAVMTVLIYVH